MNATFCVLFLVSDMKALGQSQQRRVITETLNLKLPQTESTLKTSSYISVRRESGYGVEVPVFF